MEARLAFALCAALVLAMMGPGFWLYRRVLGRLRRDHPHTWERLGRPTVVFYASRADRRVLHRFLEDGGFEALGDPDLARLCRGYRAYARVYTALLVALAILFALAVAPRFL